MIRFTVIIFVGVLLTIFASEDIEEKDEMEGEAGFQDGSETRKAGKPCIENNSSKRCWRNKRCCSRNCSGGFCRPDNATCLPGAQCGGLSGIPCCENLRCLTPAAGCADCFGVCVF